MSPEDFWATAPPGRWSAKKLEGASRIGPEGSVDGGRLVQGGKRWLSSQVAAAPYSANRRPVRWPTSSARSSTRGVVVDVFARVSLVGIELLRVDARIVIASVDTYLQFAEAANRLELGTQEPEQLSDVASDITESGAKAGASRIAEGKAKGFLDNLLSPTDEDEKARSRDD